LSSSQPIARIDLGALKHNYGEVRRLTGPSVETMAMVKADAYGHGGPAVAAALAAVGCRTFGVANLDEAASIREATPAARILVFGGLLADDAPRAVNLGVEVVTQELETVRALGAAASADGVEIGIHLKVDTGMRRLGVATSDASGWYEKAGKTRDIKLLGLCSHFAMAESVVTAVTAGQLERLNAVAAQLRTRGWVGQTHIANSAAILSVPQAHLDMVRPGLMLYGLYPSAELRVRANLRPVMAFDAPIVRIGGVGPDEGIGYGHSYRASAPMRVATIRCGYADGYPRALSNRGRVLVRGAYAPVVGRVCMDHTMIDVTRIGETRVGDRVRLWGPGLDAVEVAADADTIAYELVARVGPRVRRQYEDPVSDERAE
jgi:alanine racemase